LKRVQKTGSDGADVTCCGRLFQIRTAAKLGRRRLRVGYGEQTARETKQNAVVVVVVVVVVLVLVVVVVVVNVCS